MMLGVGIEQFDVLAEGRDFPQLFVRLADRQRG
jgi:hypothetical protein